MARMGLRVAVAAACVALFGVAAAFVASRDEIPRVTESATPTESRAATAAPRVTAAPSDAAAPTATDASPNAIPAPHALNGTVREEGGRALRGAIVHADPTPVFPNVPEHRTAVEATADADGAFDLRHLSGGDWTLSVSADGSVRAYAAVVRVPDVARFDLVVPRGATVAGSLVDETTSAPVAGAHVRLVDSRDAVVGDAATDRAGRFEVLTHRELTGVDRFEVRADGYVRAPTMKSPQSRLDDLRTGRRAEVALVARPGATLSGSVVGPDGAVGGARVTLRRSFHYTSVAPPPRVTTSGPTGLYRFDHVDADEYVVHAESTGLVQEGGEAPEFADATRWSSNDVPESALANVPGEGALQLDVRMSRVQPFARCTIEGRVEEDGGEGRGVAGVRVFTLAGPLSVEATTDADGKFVLAGVPTGGEHVEIAVVADGDFTQSVDAPAGGHTTGVVLYWSKPALPAHARGRVVAAGTGVGGARVVVVTSSENQMHCYGVGPFVRASEGRSAADGSFDFPFGREGDEAWIVAEAPGFGTGFVTLSESDLVEKPVDVELPALVPVEGRVVRAGTDEAVGGVTIRLAPVSYAATADGVTHARVVATTAADGSFRIGAVAAGERGIIASAPGWLDWDETVEVPSHGPVRIELSPAFRIAGRATFADGRPAVGLDVTAFAQGGADSEPTGAGRPAVTAADGSFVCEDLQPGRFVLHVDGGVPRVVPRRVGPFDAGVSDAVVDVVPGLTLRGSVLDLGGDPVQEADVTVTLPGAAEPAGRAKTKDSGAFSIDGLPAGVLALDVCSAACLRPPRREVRAGGEALDVRLDRGLAISGVVLKADGTPSSFGNLSAEPVDAEAPAEARIIKAESDGSFRVTGLTRGRWRIVSGYNTKLADDLVVDAGAEHLELHCAPPPKDDEAK